MDRGQESGEVGKSYHHLEAHLPQPLIETGKQHRSDNHLILFKSPACTVLILNIRFFFYNTFLQFQGIFERETL